MLLLLLLLLSSLKFDLFSLILDSKFVHDKCTKFHHQNTQLDFKHQEVFVQVKMSDYHVTCDVANKLWTSGLEFFSPRRRKIE